MPGCSAHRCGNNSSFKYEDNEERPTFHHFPTDPVRRQIWTQILRDQGKKPRRNSKNPKESLQEWTPNYTNASICSDHFEDKYILKPPTNRSGRSLTTLTEDAIPTIFGEAANKNRKRISCENGSPNKKKRRMSESDEKASTSSSDMEQIDCTSNSNMGELSIQDQTCHQIVLANAILSIDEQNPSNLYANIPKNEAALEVPMETTNLQDNLVQDIVAFDDTVDKNQTRDESAEKNVIDFIVVTKENMSANNEGSDGETAQNVDSHGKVVTLPIGNNQKLCLSVLSKLGGDINCVEKNGAGPFPTMYFHITTADGLSAMFRAKVEATEPEIPAPSGSTNPFIEKAEHSDIALDTISEVEDLVKKFKASALSQVEYEKLKVVAKALDAEDKQKSIDNLRRNEDDLYLVTVPA